MQIQEISGGICAASGFKASGVHCGIRHNRTKKDLALIVSEVPCTAAAVYTQNKVKGAPLAITKANIANGTAQGILCNSGNANTCNPNGAEIAQTCCQLAADATGLAPTDFIVASTGVIGQPMEIAPFATGIPAAAKALSHNGSADAGDSIMTTDTVRKEFSVQFTLGSTPCHLGVIAKGSGMIHPNMATLLVFATTDAAISSTALQQALNEVTAITFNQVSIDGDTSTNDMATVLANGLAKNEMIESTASPLYPAFVQALQHLFTLACRSIAADGEGATKLLECKVSGAANHQLARSIAKSVITSSLFKAAMFGADANWGRVLCAIGNNTADFSAEDISVVLQSSAGSVQVCKHSAYSPFSEEEAAKVLAQEEIEILIDLHSGSGFGVAWGCDLTYDYVKINGDYRT